MNQYRNQKLTKSSKNILKNFEKNFNLTTTLYLILTYKCNLKCKYCSFPKLVKNKEILMSPEIAIKGIDLWSRHIYNNYDKKREYFIIFYGGEPLLNINTLECSLKYIKKLKKESKLPKQNLHIMVDSNGILIDNKVLRLFKKYNVMVTIGCDGSKKSNDRYRIDNEGKGTFERIKNVLILLKNNKIRTFASVAITPYNISKIKNFSQFFKKYRIDGFGFNILKGKSLFTLSPKINLKRYYIDAANGIINNFRRGKETKYEYQMEKKMRSFL